MTGTSERERLTKIEQCLADATAQRQQILEKITEKQNEIDILARKGVKRPREKLPELDDRLKKLERDRTMVSLPLKQEKEILWQMSRIEKLKRQVEECEAFDGHIKAKKAEVSSLRDDLKSIGALISELRIELSTVQKATELGCTVEELLGMKVDFPEDKLGIFIGKKGQHVKQLQQKENVSIDVVRKYGSVQIIGSLKSIDATAEFIDRVLAIEEQRVELPKSLAAFVASKGISILSEIRARNPDVEIDVSRSGGSRFKGVPDDILSAKTDLLSVEIVEEKIIVTSNESAIVVGKQGATIIDLVERHQAAIEVSRGEGEGNTEATIVVRGPVSNVKDAVEEIEDLLAQHKEETHNVPIDPIVKDLLLMNKGAGMQTLFKLVNDGCRNILPGSVGVSIEQVAVKVKGKSIVMPKAVEIVSDELRMREASIRRFNIHPTVVPVLIGKGGAGIKELKGGNENVVVEIVRGEGEVAVGSYNNPEETDKVVQALQKFLEENVVKAVELDPRLFEAQFRLLMRSKYWQELKELVSISKDESLFQLFLRGKEENIEKASTLLQEFVNEHFQEEIDVSESDLRVLLRGGKTCKIAEFAQSYEVKVNSDSEKHIVTVTGKKDKVQAAKKAMDCFLNGGDGVKVAKMIVDDSSVGGLLGKGGSTKAAIEAKFPEISLSILPDQTVTIRGPELEVTNCQKHIVKLLTLSYITEKEALDEHTVKISKSPDFRGQLKLIPAQTTFEDSQVTVRGCRPDVYHALALLKNSTGNVYENRVFLETSCLRMFDKTSRDVHLSRVQTGTRTKITVDSTTSSIIVSGKKANVVAAKKQLFQFLEFLLSTRFACEPLPDRSQQLLGQPSQLGSLAEASGAFMYLDRDVGCLIITSQESSFVDKAKEVLAEKVSSLDNTIYKLEFGNDAEWLVPKLIGKNGSRIRSLRKSLEVSVEIDDNSVTLVSIDPEKLEKASRSLDAVIAEERSQCAVVELSGENMSAFVGQKGANIKEFEKQYNVRAQSSRKPRGLLRITGSAEDVEKAKVALEDWVRGRGGEEKSDHMVIFNLEASEAFLLRGLIGKNGDRINALRKRCMCQIEIDVDKGKLKITCDDEERREAAKKIVEQLLEDERRKNVLVEMSQRHLPAFIGPKGSNIREFEKTHGVRAQVLKTGGLHLSGNDEAIVKATDALREWIAKEVEASVAKDAVSTGGSEEEDVSTPLSAANGSGPVESNNHNSGKASEMNETSKSNGSGELKYKVMVAPKTADFPALSIGGTERAEGKGVVVSSESAKSTNSWASIVRNVSSESATCSKVEEPVVADEVNEDLVLPNSDSDEPANEDIQGKE